MNANRARWDFHGGLRLPEHKGQSADRPIEGAFLPSRLILPLRQHIGDPAEAVVSVGDSVAKGQVVARATGYVSAPVHASTSGVVVAIEDRLVPHPSGLSAPCIVIEPDGADRWPDDPPYAPLDPRHIDPPALRQRLREAGLVGLGGAAFPTAVKANPGREHPIDTLIINGGECEPYITCDDRLMRERPEAILEGARVLARAVGPQVIRVGIEDNKPEAIAAMRAAAAAVTPTEGPPIEVLAVPSRYPAGGEKQLIKALTGREVPSYGLPHDIGVLCQNVATLVALRDAVCAGRPLVSRVVTVTGDAIATPQNREVLLGTPFAEVIARAGGYRNPPDRLLMGGVMMGITVPSDQVPVVKATNCILALSTATVPPPGPPMPCIQCGACAQACPIELQPQELYWQARAKNLEKTQALHLFDCIECGCCSYVCPSHIPLVQYFRFAKNEIWSKEREKAKADRARERHNFRQERQEREQREKEARLEKKRAAAKAASAGTRSESTPSGERPSTAAVEAAVERAKQRRAAARDASGRADEPAAPNDQAAHASSDVSVHDDP